MINKETLGHTWSAQSPSTSMDEHNWSPQLSVLSRRLVYTYMDSIKHDIFNFDLLVCDRHQSLKIDNGRVDNMDSMAQTQWVSNISLQNNRVSNQWTELTVPLIMVLKCSLHDIFGAFTRRTNAKALKKREKFMKTVNREHLILPLGIIHCVAKLDKVHLNRQIKLIMDVVCQVLCCLYNVILLALVRFYVLKQ